MFEWPDGTSRAPKSAEEAYEWLVKSGEPSEEEAEHLAGHFSAFAYPNHFKWNARYDIGGPAEESNYNEWTKKYAAQEGKTWWDLAHSILVLVKPIEGEHEAWVRAQNAELRRLDDYPVMSDIAWSNKEWDLVLESWNTWGRRDFKRDFVKELATEDEAEREQIEDLLEELPDAFFDEWVERTFWDNRAPEVNGWNVEFQMPRSNSVLNAARAYWGRYPEDRTYEKLIEWFEPQKWPSFWRSEVTLADTAFTKWKTDPSGQKTRELRIKPSELPAHVRTLATHGGSLTVQYDEELCENLYVECRWVLHTPPEHMEENPIAMPPRAPPPKGKHWVWNERAQGWDALVR